MIQLTNVIKFHPSKKKKNLNPSMLVISEYKPIAPNYPRNNQVVPVMIGIDYLLQKRQSRWKGWKQYLALFGFVYFYVLNVSLRIFYINLEKNISTLHSIYLGAPETDPT